MSSEKFVPERGQVKDSSQSLKVDTQYYPEQDLEVVGEGLHNHANTEDAAGHLMVQEMVHGFQHMLPAGSHKLKGIMQYCKK